MRARLALMAVFVAACGGRPEGWAKDFEMAEVVGLQTSAAVLDHSLDRVIVLESPNHLGLRASYLPVGTSVATVATSPRKDRLYVLSKGVQPRKKQSDQLPQLTVIDTVPRPEIARVYELDDPFSGLSLDPEGEWAIVHAGGGLLENPNELILVNLADRDEDAFPKTIRSFGGRPSKFTFTSPLSVGEADPRRILVVQTEQDLTLVDLADLDASEITVLAPVAGNGRASRPVQVAYHDGEPDDPSDAVIAVSFDTTSVLLMGLVPGNDAHAFLPQINSIIEVGGQPSAIDFVRTDGGLRLAALVPSARHAALVDPKTTAVDYVPLPAAFSGIARITAPDDESSADSALLWAQSHNLVGIWRLDAAIGAPYNSVETFSIAVGVNRVMDVPGAHSGACRDDDECFDHYKIVEGAGAGDFYLLDLERRQASLMLTNGRQLAFSLSPDGERMWAFTPSGTELAQVDFSNLHPATVSAELPIRGVFDVGRPDTGGEGGDEARSALVVHEAASLSVTVFDALQPDGANTKFYSGLAYGGLPQ